MTTKFIVNVEACILYGNKWLLIRRGEKESHAAGLLSLVGGKMEEIDEKIDSLQSAVKREVNEELGITVQDHMEFIDNSYFVSKLGNHVVNIVFMCRHLEGTPISQDIDEVSEIIYLTTDEILNNDTVPTWTKNSIRKASEKMYENNIAK